MKLKNLLRSENFAAIALLGVVSAFVYLPLAGKFGYTHDDWYLMYAARVKGPLIFHEIFGGDRPLRALVMIPAYMAFGDNPLYYNLSAYFFRLLSGLGFLWMLRLLWPKQRVATLWMALLFLIYPGFLSQPNGIDYQSQMVALAAATFSLALTLKVFLSSGIFARASSFTLSVLLAWLYLGLVEYFIGVEVLRLLLILTLALRVQGNWLTKTRRAVWQSSPFLLASLPFLVWRFFIFESERGATDIGMQLSGFISNPPYHLALWFLRLLEDVFNIILAAWAVPFYQLFYQTEPKLLIGAVAFALFLIALVLFPRHWREKDAEENPRWRCEALWLGAFSLVACQLPIVLVNRQVSFPAFSRYALAGSLGATMILVALLYALKDQRIRLALLSGLVMVATLTHTANAAKFAAETESINDFWWQVSWRIPHLWKGTTLVVNYPLVGTEEDYFIWGPANQIYYPEGTNEKLVQPGVYATVLNHDAVINILTRQRQEFDSRRGIETYRNYRNILILTQPTLNSCVQVIDGLQPAYSAAEKETIMLVGAYSEAEHVLTEESFHTPPETIFGSEPAHAWCYFYQKAALARQRGDWELVRALDAEASRKGIVPKDPIEWMPFLQASALLGDSTRVAEIASSMTPNPFIAQQACQILTGMDLAPEMRALAEELYCLPQ